ncbi:unnamed protein product [Prorocentrum cordatum]|uniref:Protein C10 n=1 Tax=Prorocentrum cordatum TaxID=2364126 RepID=A0ABN9V1U3_9DINO|nr:unnamed protein product [Polarella glacialis]
MEGWKKALLAAAGAGGVAAVLWYLLAEEAEGQASEDGAAAPEGGDNRKSGQGVVATGDVSKDQVIRILGDMVASQDRMKVLMKDLKAKMLAKDMDFAETYEHVRSVQPDDPLERHGLSMSDFDELVSKHQNDPQVMQGIMQIMGMPDESKVGQGKPVGEAQVIAVHAFMLQELENQLKDFSKIVGQKAWDMKTVALASQAIVAAKVERKYGLTSEDIEGAVMQNRQTLASNAEFAEINQKMQVAMSKLMGAPG